MKSGLDYRNKLILAPMVRVGTLPMRLLALEYGADLVYTEEIIDWKLLRAERLTNDVLGTIDYIDTTDGTVVFRTCAEERKKVILQIGTASVERAVAVATMVQEDVAAIDVNMGCPKDFSIKGGMGVALLYDLPRAKAILEGLVSSVMIPVTCKIRLLPDLDETVQLAKELQSTGISAIGVHGRTKTERPRDPVNETVSAKTTAVISLMHMILKCIEKLPDLRGDFYMSGTDSCLETNFKLKQVVDGGVVSSAIKNIVGLQSALHSTMENLTRGRIIVRSLENAHRFISVSPRTEGFDLHYCIDAIAQVANALHIPVIANGGSQSITRRHDVLQFARRCGTTSAMVARAAEWNCSLFRADGPLPLDEVIQRYITLSVRYDNSPSNTKYCVQMMLRSLQETPIGRRLLDSQTMQQICDIWELGEYCRETQLKYHHAGIKGRRACRPRTLSIEDQREEANESDQLACKKQCLEGDNLNQTQVMPLIEENICFIRSNFPSDNSLPKTKLYTYATRNALPRAQYEVQQKDKLFRATIQFAGNRYSSSFWEKNKRFAEQAAALVCLLHLGVEERSELIANGAMLPEKGSTSTEKDSGDVKSFKTPLTQTEVNGELSVNEKGFKSGAKIVGNGVQT